MCDILRQIYIHIWCRFKIVHISDQLRPKVGPKEERKVEHRHIHVQGKIFKNILFKNYNATFYDCHITFQACTYYYVQLIFFNCFSYIFVSSMFQIKICEHLGKGYRNSFEIDIYYSGERRSPKAFQLVMFFPGHRQIIINFCNQV